MYPNSRSNKKNKGSLTSVQRMFHTLASARLYSTVSLVNFTEVQAHVFTFVHATELTRYLHVNVYVTHLCRVRSHVALTFVTTNFLRYLTHVHNLRFN